MLLKTAFIDERLGHFVTRGSLGTSRTARARAASATPVTSCAPSCGAGSAAIRVRQGQFASGARAAAEAVRLAGPLGDSPTLARALMTLDFARSRVAGRPRPAGNPTRPGDLQ